MTSNAQIVMAPQRPDPNNINTSIFLAGTTTSTSEPDWRETLAEAIKSYPVTIFNPNRPDWDGTWKEDFSDERWQEQIWWELDMQERADIVIFFFHKATDAPISLMELGMAVKSEPKKMVIVCVQDEYKKRGNVQAVCMRHNAALTNTEEELRQALLTTLNKLIH